MPRVTFTVEYQSRFLQQARKIGWLFHVCPAMDHVRCDNPYHHTCDCARVEERPRRLGLDIQQVVGGHYDRTCKDGCVTNEFHEAVLHHGLWILVMFTEGSDEVWPEKRGGFSPEAVSKPMSHTGDQVCEEVAQDQARAQCEATCHGVDS